MRGVSVKRVVSLNLSAGDWELYKGGEAVVADLNSEVAKAISNSDSREEAYHEAGKVLWKYREWGTADTEGHAVLTDILDDVFG